MELALLQLEVKMVLSQFMKDLLHVVAMFGQIQGVSEDVFNIDDDEPMEELPEHLIHEPFDPLKTDNEFASPCGIPIYS